MRSTCLILTTTLTLALAGLAYSDGKKDKDLNPQKDKDVQRGIDDYKREHRQKDIKDHYEVKTSNDLHSANTEPTTDPRK